MRSVPSGSFERLSAAGALWSAWHRARRGKRRTVAAATFEVDAERQIFALHHALRDGRYRPSPLRIHIIRDPKVRPISICPFADRVVHQALHAELAPHYDRSLIDHTYACLPGRGTHRAILRYLQCTRRYGWRLSLDIRRYFLSIDHAILRNLVFARLRDPRTRALIDALLAASNGLYQRPHVVRALPDLAADPVAPGVGLPIGTLFSQWSANLYLSGADHFIKRTLKVPVYQRYMDDLTLFADDREQLETARAEIAAWLARERRLQLNPKRWRVCDTADPSIYLQNS